MNPPSLRSLPRNEISTLSVLHQALWHEAEGDWDAAHRLAQDIETTHGAWVHAYLHRREGDSSNAAYWYRRANKPVFTGSFADEWASIAEALPDPAA